MPKQIPLSQGLYAVVDDRDYEWLSQWKWHAYRDGSTFYAVRDIHRPNRETVKMHRLILERHTEGTETNADHKDRDGLNNQLSNLRWASNSQNQANKGPRADNECGYKGVCKDQGGWKAQIRIGGKPKHLGRFDTVEQAARAYDEAAKKLYGEFAWLNFP